MPRPPSPPTEELFPSKFEGEAAVQHDDAILAGGGGGHGAQDEGQSDDAGREGRSGSKDGEESSQGARDPRELRAVLKLSTGTLASQAELLATQLGGAMGVATPSMRLLRRKGDEWERMRQAIASASGGEVAAEDLRGARSALLMSFVDGGPLLSSLRNTAPHTLPDTMGAAGYAIGRVLALDLVLHNEDRLPSAALGWRGNAANVMWSRSAGGPVGQLVAIDTGLPRR